VNTFPDTFPDDPRQGRTAEPPQLPAEAPSARKANPVNDALTARLGGAAERIRAGIAAIADPREQAAQLAGLERLINPVERFAAGFRAATPAPTAGVGRLEVAVRRLRVGLEAVEPHRRADVESAVAVTLAEAAQRAESAVAQLGIVTEAVETLDHLIATGGAD
jgi:hypothetical protein